MCMYYVTIREWVTWFCLFQIYRIKEQNLHTNMSMYVKICIKIRPFHLYVLPKNFIFFLSFFKVFVLLLPSLIFSSVHSQAFHS